MSFERLIRFVDENDNTIYGNLKEALPSQKILGLDVQVLSGSLEDGFLETNKTAKVKKVCTCPEKHH